MQDRFTIHYGEIKTSTFTTATTVPPYLQSTMVRLRRLAVVTSDRLGQVFTIHYGEIKTKSQKSSYIADFYLQSTMVRLRLNQNSAEHYD